MSPLRFALHNIFWVTSYLLRVITDIKIKVLHKSNMQMSGHSVTFIIMFIFSYFYLSMHFVRICHDTYLLTLVLLEWLTFGFFVVFCVQCTSPPHAPWILLLLLLFLPFIYNIYGQMSGHVCLIKCRHEYKSMLETINLEARNIMDGIFGALI